MSLITLSLKNDFSPWKQPDITLAFIAAALTPVAERIQELSEKPNGLAEVTNYLHRELVELRKDRGIQTTADVLNAAVFIGDRLHECKDPPTHAEIASHLEQIKNGRAIPAIKQPTIRYLQTDEQAYSDMQQELDKLREVSPSKVHLLMPVQRSETINAIIKLGVAPELMSIVDGHLAIPPVAMSEQQDVGKLSQQLRLPPIEDRLQSLIEQCIVPDLVQSTNGTIGFGFIDEKAAATYGLALSNRLQIDLADVGAFNTAKSGDVVRVRTETPIQQTNRWVRFDLLSNQVEGGVRNLGTAYEVSYAHIVPISGLSDRSRDNILSVLKEQGVQVSGSDISAKLLGEQYAGVRKSITSRQLPAPTSRPLTPRDVPVQTSQLS